MCFVVTCWERADLLALVCGVFCEFVTFPLVSWVRCGTWLYRFLIFAPLLTSPSSTNREKFKKIERSDRLLHPEDWKKNQSLIRLFSNWDKKKKHTKNSHWSDCYLLSILRNLVGKFEIHMILLSLYLIYLSTSLHLSEVSGIFDLLPTWAFPSENVT